MEILTFIGLIAIVILLFVCGGLIGWRIKGFVEIVKFLFEGCGTTIADTQGVCPPVCLAMSLRKEKAVTSLL